MNISFVQACPSCAAPLELSEGELLIDCQFCGVKNYMVVSGALRLVLPDKIPQNIDGDDIFYIPYVRFKGAIYSHKQIRVDHKIMDTTQSGVAHEKLPTSLGVRPQAMNLKVLEGNPIKGRFVKRTEALKNIFDRASHLNDYFSKSPQQEVIHRAFIGETISLIYLPVYRLNGVLLDGVTNRSLRVPLDIIKDEKSSCKYQKSWGPKFLAMICPHCGAVLGGEADSLVLHCHNCEKAWYVEKNKFTEVDWVAGRSEKDTIPQLPFWKIAIETVGVDLKTYGDFLRKTNQPILVKPEYDSKRLAIYIPAFKVNPKSFLSLSKRFTVSQIKLVAGSREAYGRLFPVTLPVSEAQEAIKSVLVYSAVNKKQIAPIVKSLKIWCNKKELIYLPFIQKGMDLVQPESRVSIPSSVLHLGRNL